MISTVTTTVSTIVSSSSAVGLMASLGIAGVVTLISSLVIKELASAGNAKFRIFGNNLEIVVLPLIFVFAFIVVIKVLEIIS